MAIIQNGVDFASLLQSGQFSDLTVVCKGQEFKIHKLVACPQSPVFAAAVKGEFKEAQTGVIHIELFDPKTVRCMVEYLYTGNYTDQPPQQSKAVTVTAAPVAAPSGVKSQNGTAPAKTGTAPPVSAVVPTKVPATVPAAVTTKDALHHVRVNAIADYYGIQGLTLLANQKIQRIYQNRWDAEGFLDSAKEALSVTGDKSLHNMMALLIAQKLPELLGSGQLTSLVGEFAVQILRYQAHLLEASERDQSQAVVQQQSDLQTRCQAAEARAARILVNVCRLVTVMCDREYCRNGACGEDFGCYVEATGEEAEPTFVLRCSSCLCRHT
ncbi:hypothetical protein ACHAQJ_004427 [Trichoderma viride]